MRLLTADDPRTAGDFRLRARLGAGGMGVVYLGFSPAGRAVAVKVVQPSLAGNQAFLTRFRHEVAAVRAVSGFYTAPVVAAGPDDHPPWLATAFVPGPDLDEVITTHGPLPEDALWRLAAGLTEALRSIHGSGVIHRDLKPSNVLLAADGPRLIDFGISHAPNGPALTATGQVFGSPGYMSPEQAEGRRVGPPSDVFSLGCLLAFAATGRHAFGNGSGAVMLYRVVHGEAALVGMPARLRDLTAACLAKDPAARPPLAALAQAIDGSLEEEPSGTSFWPDPVAAVLAGYQASLEADMKALAASSRPGVPVGRPTGPPVTASQAGPVFPAATVVPPPAASIDGQHDRSSAHQGVSRRRVLALGAVSAAGLGVAGWRLGASGGPSKPGASSSGRADEPGSGTSGTSVSGRAPLWTFPAGGQVQTGLTVVNGLLYAGTDTGWIYAIETTTGRRRWYYHADSQVQAGPVVYDGLLYAGDIDGTLYALDAATGRFRWRHPFGAPGTSEPVPGGGLIFLAGETQMLYVLNARTGAARNPIPTTYDVNQDLVGADGILYTGDNPGSVLAFRQDGTQVWSKPVTTGSMGPMAVAGGVVYVPDSDGKLHALNAATGEIRWSKAPPLVVGAELAVAEAPPVAAGGMVAVVSGDTLYAFRVSDGQLAWKFSVGPSLGRPAASGGLFYVAGQTPDGLGAVYAVSPSNGHRVQLYAGEVGTAKSGIAVADGRVYIGDDTGNILALSR
jgi:outer membrane protein assembly factor BamB